MRKLLVIFFLLCSVASFAQQKGDGYFIVSKINLVGNKVTKESTIFREMLFHEGDTIRTGGDNAAISDEIIKESRENLLNTTLFNFVDFDWLDVDKHHKVLTITMVERWYLWPIPYLAYADRNLKSWYDADKITRLSYGFDLVYCNLWGLKHELDLTIIGGYNQNFGVTYDIPYLTKRQRLGVKLSSGLIRNRELAYITENDRIKYFDGEDDYAHESFYAFLMPSAFAFSPPFNSMVAIPFLKVRSP